MVFRLSAAASGNRGAVGDDGFLDELRKAAKAKRDELNKLLADGSLEKILIFSRTKHGADKIARKIESVGIKTERIHSNRSQSQRTAALEKFRSGKSRVLVATDIAARGIDVDGISHVINFDTPNQAEDYIHRIGRTGRAQTTGEAITFVSQDEEAYLRQIERHTGSRLERKAYDGFVAAPAGNGESRSQSGSGQNGSGQNGNGRSRSQGSGSRNGGGRNGGDRRLILREVVDSAHPPIADVHEVEAAVRAGLQVDREHGGFG